MRSASSSRRGNLRGAVPFQQRTLAEIDRKIIAHVHEYGKDTNRSLEYGPGALFPAPGKHDTSSGVAAARLLRRTAARRSNGPLSRLFGMHPNEGLTTV
jgi:hypothetical protein